MPTGSLDGVPQVLEPVCPLMNNSRTHLNGPVADNLAKLYNFWSAKIDEPLLQNLGLNLWIKSRGKEVK
jgi:hypothetical protein